MSLVREAFFQKGFPITTISLYIVLSIMSGNIESYV